jgi:hypothetical protein
MTRPAVGPRELPGRAVGTDRSVQRCLPEAISWSAYDQAFLTCAFGVDHWCKGSRVATSARSLGQASGASNHASSGRCAQRYHEARTRPACRTWRSRPNTPGANVTDTRFTTSVSGEPMTFTVNSNADTRHAGPVQIAMRAACTGVMNCSAARSARGVRSGSVRDNSTSGTVSTNLPSPPRRRRSRVPRDAAPPPGRRPARHFIGCRT